MSLKGPKKYNMASPIRMRKRAARRQARKYRKMSSEERLQRVEAAKARRAQNQKSTSSVSYKVSTPVDKAAKVKAVKADIKKKKSISKQNEITIANRKAAAAAKPGETYIRTMKDGTKKTVRAVKKAEKGSSLKAVPKDNKGLSKLPTGVRNKMGYAQDGGKLGGKPKRYTENGVTYVWDEERQTYLGDMGGNVAKGGLSSDFGTAFKAAKRFGKDEFTWQGKKYSTKTKEEMKSVKKMKDGGKVGNLPKKKKEEKVKAVKKKKSISKQNEITIANKKDGNRLLKKSERLQKKDTKLKAKATEAYASEKDKKAGRIQDRRIRVQKRENKAFSKGYGKKLASGKK